MFIENLQALVRIAVMAVCVYPAVILILRITGKRSLSKLNAFDFVVTVALGSVLATVIVSGDVTLAGGILAFAMLAGLQWLIARLMLVSPPLHALVRSRPRLLVRDGVCLERAMKAERVTFSDIAAAARQAGLGDLAEAGAVVLETDGSLSVLKGESRRMPLLSGLIDGRLQAGETLRNEGP